MPLSSNPGQYADVRAVFDAALTRGGVRYELPTEGAATHWRQRAYHFRRLLFQINREQYASTPGILPSTPYDAITLRREGCVIVVTTNRPLGQITSLDGQPLTLEPADEPADAELLEALRLVEEHGA